MMISRITSWRAHPRTFARSLASPVATSSRVVVRHLGELATGCALERIARAMRARSTPHMLAGTTTSRSEKTAASHAAIAAETMPMWLAGRRPVAYGAPLRCSNM